MKSKFFLRKSLEIYVYNLKNYNLLFRYKILSEKKYILTVYLLYNLI
ncbi:hypothetical protein BN166_1040021 [Clostridioides difficile E10]|nr:hypothetical protein BN166_1040021 [Clostridioides difficile E10]